MILKKVFPVFIIWALACSSASENAGNRLGEGGASCTPQGDAGNAGHQQGGKSGNGGTANERPSSCKEIEYDMYKSIQSQRRCTADADCKMVLLRCLSIDGDRDGQFGIRADADTSALEDTELALEACIKRTENLDEEGLLERCLQLGLNWGIHCVHNICRAGGGQ